MVMQSMYEAERIIRDWEDRHSEPPEREGIQPCCECGCEPEFVVDDRFYCKSCVDDLYGRYVYDEPIECSNCSEEIGVGDFYYEADGEDFCTTCFTEVFEI